MPFFAFQFLYTLKKNAEILKFPQFLDSFFTSKILEYNI